MPTIIPLNLNQAGFPSSKKNPTEEKVDPTTIIFSSNKEELVHSVQNLFLEVKGEEIWGKPEEESKSAQCRVIAGQSGSKRLDWKGEKHVVSQAYLERLCVSQKPRLLFHLSNSCRWEEQKRC